METTERVAANKNVTELVSERTRELELAHKQLVQANEYLQQIINSFKAPLQVLHPIFDQGKIQDFSFKLTNKAYSAYANTTPENLQDRRVGEVFPGYFHTSSFYNVVKAYETGIPDTWEIHYDQDGLNLYNEMNAARLGDDIVVHFTDFTKLKGLQLELEKNIEQLSKSNDSLQEFSNAASHDLKEPIRKITVFLSRLKIQLQQHLQEADLQLFSKIEGATLRMGSLIEDLMLFAHFKSNLLKKLKLIWMSV